MLALFWRSLCRHLGWWLAALWPGKHPGAPLFLPRLLFLLLGYPLFVALQLIHWLGLLLDELLFAAYRKVEVKEPVFIAGIPRSGTTFLHRTLAADSRFTSFSTWEALMAPSITGRKLIRGLSAIDRAIGEPGKALLNAALRKSTGELGAIHEVGLEAPEEDYLALLPVGGCFLLLLAFPYARELEALARLDDVPENDRRALLRFYKNCLQKHLYCHPGKQLLSKNAAFASWCPALGETFPDARFLLCVRDPAEALSSQLSSLAPARALFGTDPDGSHTAAQFSGVYAHAYTALAGFVATSGPGQVAVLAQADLRTEPAGTIRTTLDQLQLERSPSLDAALDALGPGKPSKHRHQPSGFSTDSSQIDSCMRPAYEEILESPNRSQPKPS